MSFQVFISYARTDNMVPVGSGAQYGFISLLRANLGPALARRGISNVQIWRDKEAIADGEHLTPKILSAIAESQIMIVVMTPASLQSDYCGRELEAFAARSSMQPDG